MIAATSVPNWMTADAAAPGSPHPRTDGTISRCAVELMGMNSVRPWTRPRTIASMMVMFLLHLPNHRQDHRPPSHFLAEVAFEEAAHFLLSEIVVEQFVRPALMQHLHELCANLGQDVLALVDMEQSAGDDLRLPPDIPVGVDGYDHDDEAVFCEMLAVADDDLRNFLGL